MKRSTALAVRLNDDTPTDNTAHMLKLMQNGTDTAPVMMLTTVLGPVTATSMSASARLTTKTLVGVFRYSNFKAVTMVRQLNSKTDSVATDNNTHRTMSPADIGVIDV